MKLYPYQKEFIKKINDGELTLDAIPRGYGKSLIARELNKPPIPRHADGSEVHGLPRKDYA